MRFTATTIRAAPGGALWSKSNMDFRCGAVAIALQRGAKWCDMGCGASAPAESIGHAGVSASTRDPLPEPPSGGQQGKGKVPVPHGAFVSRAPSTASDLPGGAGPAPITQETASDGASPMEQRLWSPSTVPPLSPPPVEASPRPTTTATTGQGEEGEHEGEDEASLRAKLRYADEEADGGRRDDDESPDEDGDGDAAAAQMLRQELYARLPPAAAAQVREADKYVALGSRHFVEGGFDHALEFFATGLDLRQRALGRAHALTAAAESDCGLAADLAGLPERAERHHRAALEARQELFGSESEETASSQHNLGAALEAMGDVEGAAEGYANALAVRRRLGKSDDAADSAAALGRLRADAGEEAEAVTLFREALEVYRHTLGDHSKTADVAMSLGLALLGTGEEQEGEAMYQEAADMQERIRAAEEALEAAEMEEAEARLATEAARAAEPSTPREAQAMMDSMALDALEAEVRARAAAGVGGGVGSPPAAVQNASKLSVARRTLGRSTRGGRRRARRAQLQDATAQIDLLLSGTLKGME